MSDVQRILVVATQQLGDVLLTTPLIRSARRRWPQARIDVLGFTGTLGMLRGNPDVGELIEVNARAKGKERSALLRRLWRRYDLALVTRGSDRAHIYGWIAGKMRAGIVPVNAGGRWLKRLLLKHVVDEAPDSHAVLEKLQLLAPWVDVAREPVHLVPPPAAPLPSTLQTQLRARFAVVHTPSMWRYKQWPVEHFKVLVAGLVEHGLQVLLTGSSSPQDRELVAEVATVGVAPQVIDLAGALDLNQLGGVLGRAALYVGPDAAITHLAAACDTPSVALFGPTPPTAWGPWPAGHAARQPYERVGARQAHGRVILLQGPAPCVPCGREGCDNHRGSRSDCLIALEPALVLREALALAQAARPSASASSASTWERTELS